MAFTLEDYKHKLEELTSNRGDKNFMEWRDGPNIGRIMPGHPNMEGFYEEVKEHKKGKGKDFVSVVCTGDDCEICPTLAVYRKSKDKEDQKIWKEQQPKPRFYFNWLDKGKDGKQEPVLTIAAVGTQILQGILGLLCDEDYGESIITPGKKGRDINISKGMAKNKQIEYNVTPRANLGPAMADMQALAKIIGTDAEDTQLYDMLLQHEQFDDPSKALLVWEQGWEALKEAAEEEDAKPKAKDKSPAAKSPLHAVVAAKEAAAKKKPIAPEPEEDEEAPPIISFPRLKSRCAICGEKRHKTPDGAVCPSGHTGEPLAEDARPKKPSKAYLKEFPEPVEDEEEESEEEVEEDDDIPSEDTEGGDEDEDLGDLDSIIAKHKKAKK